MFNQIQIEKRYDNNLDKPNSILKINDLDMIISGNRFRGGFVDQKDQSPGFGFNQLAWIEDRITRLVQYLI